MSLHINSMLLQSGWRVETQFKLNDGIFVPDLSDGEFDAVGFTSKNWWSQNAARFQLPVLALR